MVAENNSVLSPRLRWVQHNLPIGVKKKPRPYQTSVMKALSLHLADHKQGMAHLATGAGKTFIAMEWLRKQIASGSITPKKPVVWMVHRKDLLPQAMKELYSIPAKERKRLGLNENGIAVLGTSLNQYLSNGLLLEGVSKTPLVYFTTRQSFAHCYDEFSLSPSFIVWDECHQGDGGKFQQGPTILSNFKRKRTKFIGLTATPKTNSCTFADTDVVYSKNLQELIDMGYLAKPISEDLHTSIDWTPETGATRNSDFTNLHVLNTAERNQKIVKHYVKHKKKYGKTIVFAIDIEHSESLIKLFHSHNVSATLVHSGMRSASVQQNIQDYRCGRKDVIINVTMLAEGFDAPETESIFMCRPTNSETLYLQSIGRGTRIAEGSKKKSFYIVDFVDNMTRHKDTLVIGARFFDSTSATRSVYRPSQARLHAERGEHFFQSNGTPSYICSADGLPKELQDFWVYPDQTFGVEIELTGEDWYKDKVFKKEGKRIIQKLTADLGTEKVHRQLFYENAGISTQWNVERDPSCGWEVVSPVLQGIEGLKELATALNALNQLTKAHNLSNRLTVNYSTGLHLHLGAKGTTLSQLKSLVLEIHKAEPMLGALVSQSRINQFQYTGSYKEAPNKYCNPIRSQITKKSMQEITQKQNFLRKINSRYSTVNLKPMLSQKTIEFRLHNGTTDAVKVIRWLSICQQLFHQAIKQGDWNRDLSLYTRRKVIVPASKDELKQWILDLPGGHKTKFSQSVLKRFAEIKRRPPR